LPTFKFFLGEYMLGYCLSFLESLPFGVVQGFCDRFKGELIRQEGATKEVEPIYVKKKFYRIDTKEEGQVVNIIVDKVSGKTRVVVPGRKDGLAAPFYRGRSKKR